MSNEFKVGDRVLNRHVKINPTVWTVVGVEGDYVWVLEDGDRQPVTAPASNCVLYVEPWTYPGGPEQWVNVYQRQISYQPVASRAQADFLYAEERKHLLDCPERIGVLHLFPDGHTEMEAP